MSAHIPRWLCRFKGHLAMDLTFESRKRRQVLSALSNPLTFVTVVTKILISIILIIQQAGTLEVSADAQNDDFYQCGARVGLDAISPGGKFSQIYISNVMHPYTKIALLKYIVSHRIPVKGSNIPFRDPPSRTTLN